MSARVSRRGPRRCFPPECPRRGPLSVAAVPVPLCGILRYFHPDSRAAHLSLAPREGLPSLPAPAAPDPGSSPGRALGARSAGIAAVPPGHGAAAVTRLPHQPGIGAAAQILPGHRAAQAERPPRCLSLVVARGEGDRRDHGARAGAPGRYAVPADPVWHPARPAGSRPGS